MNHSIFYDQGRRWRKVIFAGFICGVIFCGTLAAVVYAFFYTPFPSASSYDSQRLLTAITDINNRTRPVIDEGTFVTPDFRYSEPYIRRFGEYRETVILTFDDGPDPVYTPKILAILKKENVPATFFVIGKMLNRYPEVARLILEEGMDLGLHTYSHQENAADEKLPWWNELVEFDFSEKIFYHELGYKTNLFRVPYLGVDPLLSYNSLQLIAQAASREMVVSAPTVDSLDWLVTRPEEVYRNAITTDARTAVILFHDAGGRREHLLEALPQVIDYYRKRGYEFTTVSRYAEAYGLTAQIEPTQADRIMAPLAYHTYTFFTRYLKIIITDGFAAGFILILLHNLGMGMAASLSFFRESLRKAPKSRYRPRVSVIIPMFNEEKVIARTVRATLRLKYPSFEVIVVDDGSTDGSLALLEKFSGYRNFRIIRQENQGKAAALNAGVSAAGGRIIVTVDADTILLGDALSEIADKFRSRRVGAVSGNIRVGNRMTLLGKLQEIEYTIGQSIDKRVMHLTGSVMITPGAFGAWRKQAILRAGMFTSDTLAEDFDLTVRVIKAGYNSLFTERALAVTEVPDTVGRLLRQRFRWNYGNLQVVAKHRSELFRRKSGYLGLVFLPRLIFWQIPVMLLTLFVDLIIPLSFFTGQFLTVAFFLFLYFLMQYLTMVFAFLLERRQGVNPLLPVMIRFGYTQLLYGVLYYAVYQAIRGQMINWTKTHHTGSVRLLYSEQVS